MNLFIDDVRDPHQVGLKDAEWYIARDYHQAVDYILVHKPQVIAFDHDLSLEHYHGKYSGEKTGYDVAKWLVQWDMEHPEGGFITKDFQFTCHSANPDGKRNILNLLARYYRNKFHLNPNKETAHV